MLAFQYVNNILPYFNWLKHLLRSCKISIYENVRSHSKIKAMKPKRATI